MCNLAIAGMVDSLCRGCRSAEPDGKCPHCDSMLCGDCQSGHLSFDVAKQTLQGVDQAMKQGKDAADTSDIRQLCDRMQDRVNQAIDHIIERCQERRQALLLEVIRVTDIEVTSRQAWSEQLPVRLATTEAELADLTSRLGNEWSDNITQGVMADVDKHGQNMIDEMKEFMLTIPVVSQPTFLFDDTDALAAISSFGSINASPPDSAGAMAAVTWGRDVCVCVCV